jgi:hypothetical protein
MYAISALQVQTQFRIYLCAALLHAVREEYKYKFCTVCLKRKIDHILYACVKMVLGIEI